MKLNINWKWRVNKEHFDKNMSTNQYQPAVQVIDLK